MPSLERKRSLRSAQTTTTVPQIKTEPTSTSTRQGSRRVKKDCIDSDESDESDDDLTKPVFGETIPKPKPWKFPSTKESETFGENVITSTEFKEKSVDNFNIKRDPSSDNANSRSFTAFETKQEKEDENGNKNMNVKSEKMDEKMENMQKITEFEAKNNGKSPSKFEENLNDQGAEISWIGKEKETPTKQMEDEGTMASQLFEKEEIDSSIEIGMNKSRRHAKRVLTDDLEEEEDSRGPLAKFGIEVDDDDVVGLGHGFRKTTG